MTDEADFLRTIIERPADPLARQVFADWLEGCGRYTDGTFQRILAEPDRDDLRLRWADVVEAEQPERAEFVRVQVELAKSDADLVPDDDGSLLPLLQTTEETRAALRRRERELLHTHSPTWYGPLYEMGVIPGYAADMAADFARGFPCRVRISWSDWVRHGAALLNAAPIRRVNRGKRCTRCRGGIIYPSDDVPCEYCRGTGRVDDWRGDGLVRLTTWPDDRWLIRQGFGRLAGDLPTDRLLAAEFPGVRFELPAAGVWDAPARSTPLADIRALQNRVRSLGRPVVPHLPDREAVRLIAAAHGRPDPFTADTPEARP